jgi:hypothetical protein
MKKAAIIFLVFVLLPAAAIGGPGWGPNENFLDWRTGSFVALRFDGYPSADFKEQVNGEDWGSLYTNELNFYAYTNWKLGDYGSKTWLLFNYGILSLDFEELRSAGEYSFDRTEHFSLAWGGLWYVVEDEYALRGVFIPGVSADMGDVPGGEAFTPEGKLHVMWYPEEGWSAGIGAVYTYDTGVPRILPSLIIDRETDRFRLEMFLPHYTDFFYKPGKGFEVGIAYEIWGEQYARDPEDFEGLADPSLSYSVSSIGGGIGYWFDKWLYMRIDVGYLFDRRLRYMDGDTDVLVLDPEDSVYMKGYVITGKF